MSKKRVILKSVLFLTGNNEVTLVNKVKLRFVKLSLFSVILDFVTIYNLFVLAASVPPPWTIIALHNNIWTIIAPALLYWKVV